MIHPLTYNRWITQRRILTITAVIWTLSLLVELPQVLAQHRNFQFDHHFIASESLVKCHQLCFAVTAMLIIIFDDLFRIKMMIIVTTK